MRPPRKREAAQRIIASLLAEREVPERQVAAAMEEAGIRRDAYFAARREAGVLFRRDGWQGSVLLRLPPAAAPLNPDAFHHGREAVAFLKARKRYMSTPYRRPVR